MNPIIFDKIKKDHPDCEIVILLTGTSVPDASLGGIVHQSVGAEPIHMFRNQMTPNMRLAILPKCEILNTARSKDYPVIHETSGFPVIRVPEYGMVMFLMDMHNRDAFAAIEDGMTSIYDIRRADIGDTYISVPGMNLYPICSGVMLPAEGLAEAIPANLEDIARLTSKATLTLRGITDFPKGIEDDFGSKVLVAPNVNDEKLFDVAFRNGADDVQEHFGVTAEQLFALYESRNAATIQ